MQWWNGNKSMVGDGEEEESTHGRQMSERDKEREKE